MKQFYRFFCFYFLLLRYPHKLNSIHSHQRVQDMLQPQLTITNRLVLILQTWVGPGTTIR